MEKIIKDVSEESKETKVSFGSRFDQLDAK